MIAQWIKDEVMGVDLKDKRLNSRFANVLDRLAGQPNASIPASCNGNAEMVAAYRFVENDKFDFEDLLQPHIDATYRRIAEHPVVLFPQDTTEIDCTRPNKQVAGVGPLDGNSRLGILLHPLMAFTPDGTPLGTIYAETWSRDDEPPPLKSERENIRKHTPYEEKESFRWLAAYRELNAQAEHYPNTKFVCIADSEADIYELFEAARAESGRVELLVRACQNRALRKEGDAESAVYLRERVLAEDVLFTDTIDVRGRSPKIKSDRRRRRQARNSRSANVEVRAARVTLRPPWRDDKILKPVAMNVVLITEVDPPKGETPIEWILLTTLSIDGVQQVKTIVRYYHVRWLIEIYFKTLKSGCRIEQRRFETVERIYRCLAIYMIIAWRTLYVCRLGREVPEMSCEALFDESEWKSVYHVVRQEPPPSKPPPLKIMIRLIAQLGGYASISTKDNPGPITICRGLERTHDIATCWLTFGPGAKTCVE